jgi:hypothetical protein
VNVIRSKSVLASVLVIARFVADGGAVAAQGKE